MSETYSEFFKNPEAEELKNVVDSASSTGMRSQPVNVPGSYLMKVHSFVMRKKEEKPKPFPNVATSESPKTKGALQLNINLEVIDGTPAVPAGSTLFYTVTLAQAPGATKEKQANTVGFMKPILCALTGLNSFSFDEKFVHDYLTIDFDPVSYQITREHKMINPVMCVVEEYITTSGQKGCRAKSIRRAEPGEKSVSIKKEAQENASLDNSHQQTLDMIKENQGKTTVESMELSYDPAMDSQGDFKVEDA